MYHIPIELKTANAYVAQYHRHHKPVPLHKFSLGAILNDKLVGVAIVNRPVAIARDDGWTLEVQRCCTDGTPNACSFLYSKCAKVAMALGYHEIGTYILEIEPGTSLKAVGWQCLGKRGGQGWNRKKRPRIDTEYSLMTKILYVKSLYPDNGFDKSKLQIQEFEDKQTTLKLT